MDETGQPGGEPAGASGNGAHSKGVARVNANGWQQPDPQDTRADGAQRRERALRRGRPGSLHTADSAWSAGSREPAMEPIPSWRRSAITQLTERPEQPRRLADLLAPVSPPVPPPFPFDGSHGPDGQPTAAEPAPAQPGPGRPRERIDGVCRRSVIPARSDASRSRASRRALGAATQPAPRAVPDDFDAVPIGPRALRGAAGPRPGGGRDPGRAERRGRPEPVPPEQAGQEQGWSVRDRSPGASGWAVPASGEPMPVPPPPGAGTYRSAIPVDRHRRDPGPSTDAEPDGPVRFNGAAPVSPAVPFYGGVLPTHSGPAHSGPLPSGPLHSGPPHSGLPHPGPLRGEPSPADPPAWVARPESPYAEPSNGGPPRAGPQAGSLRPEPPRAGSPYPGPPYPGRRTPEPASGAVRGESTDRGGPAPVDGRERGPRRRAPWSPGAAGTRPGSPSWTTRGPMPPVTPPPTASR